MSASGYRSDVKFLNCLLPIEQFLETPPPLSSGFSGSVTFFGQNTKSFGPKFSVPVGTAGAIFGTLPNFHPILLFLIEKS